MAARTETSFSVLDHSTVADSTHIQIELLRPGRSFSLPTHGIACFQTCARLYMIMKREHILLIVVELGHSASAHQPTDMAGFPQLLGNKFRLTDLLRYLSSSSLTLACPHVFSFLSTPISSQWFQHHHHHPSSLGEVYPSQSQCICHQNSNLRQIVHPESRFSIEMAILTSTQAPAATFLPTKLLYPHPLNHLPRSRISTPRRDLLIQSAHIT